MAKISQPKSNQTSKKMQATDQLLISGLICIKHKKSTRSGLSVLFSGKG